MGSGKDRIKDVTGRINIIRRPGVIEFHQVKLPA
jgi:hypothetical protein